MPTKSLFLAISDKYLFNKRLSVISLSIFKQLSENVIAILGKPLHINVNCLTRFSMITLVNGSIFS